MTSKEQTLEQKEQSISDRAKNLDAREEQLEEVERQKEAELERIGALSQAEARDIILAQIEENLTRRLPVAFAKLSKRSRNVLTKWPRTSWFKLCNVSLRICSGVNKLNSSSARRYYEGTHYWS